jgi:hypothetical protein
MVAVAFLAGAAAFLEDCLEGVLAMVENVKKEGMGKKVSVLGCFVTVAILRIVSTMVSQS